jgi:hypothetical protein
MTGGQRRMRPSQSASAYNVQLSSTGPPGTSCPLLILLHAQLHCASARSSLPAAHWSAATAARVSIDPGARRATALSSCAWHRHSFTHLRLRSHSHACGCGSSCTATAALDQVHCRLPSLSSSTLARSEMAVAQLCNAQTAV